MELHSGACYHACLRFSAAVLLAYALMQVVIMISFFVDSTIGIPFVITNRMMKPRKSLFLIGIQNRSLLLYDGKNDVIIS